MRFIHTGDWHIGKIINEMSMLEDQKYILDKLLNIIKQTNPDALIIAGDLYDRSVPPAKAVEVLDSFLNKVIIDMKIPVLAIAGNHDGGERLEFASGILKSQGLHIAGIVKEVCRKVTLNDAYGEVDFYLIPYVDPILARFLFKDDTIRTHEQAMKKVLESIESHRDKSRRDVVVAHGYITVMSDIDGEKVVEELEVSDSERPLSIGGTDFIDSKLFDTFNYVALGHLHGPQKTGKDYIRYSGSLLKYSFSEKKQKKSVTLVDMDEKGEISYELMPLVPLRDMREIVGEIDTLISSDFYSKSNTEDYIFAFLEDEGEVYDPMAKLRAVYPNIMGVKKLEKRDLDLCENNGVVNTKEKNKAELFQEFYENVTQKEYSSSMSEVINEIIEKVEKGVY